MAGKYVVFGPKLVENWSSSYVLGFCMGSCHSVALPIFSVPHRFVGYSSRQESAPSMPPEIGHCPLGRFARADANRRPADGKQGGSAGHRAAMAQRVRPRKGCQPTAPFDFCARRSAFAPRKSGQRRWSRRSMPPWIGHCPLGAGWARRNGVRRLRAKTCRKLPVFQTPKIESTLSSFCSVVALRQ